MLTIKRTCTNKIITRALMLEGQPLIAILRPGAEDCDPCEDEHHLLDQLEKNPESIIVYNQHREAIELVSQLQLPAKQIFIEVKQDTKGVLGLHAIRRNETRQQTLELNYL
jgi:RNase P protein component